MRFLLLNDPAAIEEVLVKQTKSFVKNVTEPVWWALLGNGLLLSDGDFWIRQRRLMQPAFYRQRIAEDGRTMVALTQRRVEGWQDGEGRDIHTSHPNEACGLSTLAGPRINPSTNEIAKGAASSDRPRGV